MTRYAILVAGGKGLRMGGDVPKQFMLIGGKPVLMWTIESFKAAYQDMEIVLVLPVEQHEYWQELCQKYDFHVPVTIACGGETRFHSVKNGLAAIPMDAEGVVGVHDGVRPFASMETIRHCYEEALSCGAVVPVTPVVETLRHLLAYGSETVSRDEYRLVQTPQTFDIQLLRKAYAQDFRPFFTDDASVVEAMEHPVRLVDGNRENIKLTTPGDLAFAEAYLSL